MPWLDHFIQQIDELDDVREVEPLRHIIKDAVKRLGMFEIALFEEHLIERTGFAPRSISVLIKEAKAFQKDHGYLHDVDGIAKAYGSRMLKEYSTVVSCGSGLHVYDDTTGTFVFAGLDEVEKHLLETFDGLPFLQRPASAKLVIKRLQLQFSEENFFNDAKAGVNLTNGFLSLDEEGNATLLPHSSDHKAQMQIPVAYDPTASFTWLEDALRVTLPAEKSLLALQEVAGAILFNVVPAKDKVRRMLLMYGAPNSGKSSMIEIIKGLLPAHSVVSIPPTHWADPNYRAGFENARLNCVTELGGSVRIGGDNFKKIVSCEPVIARRMRQNPFTFVPKAWHLCATNELMPIADKSDAFERRLLVITFPHSLTEAQVDPRFMERIQENPSAVLLWAAVGAARLRTNGRFTVPDGHRMAAAEMRFGNDVPLLFAHTQIRREPGARITTSELRTALRSFAHDRDTDPDTMHDGAIRKVADVMKAIHGATRRKLNGAPFYEGVAFSVQQTSAASGPNEVDLSDL